MTNRIRFTKDTPVDLALIGKGQMGLVRFKPHEQQGPNLEPSVPAPKADYKQGSSDMQAYFPAGTEIDFVCHVTEGNAEIVTQ